ncbi:Uncharacterized protein HZ326_10767 [Fusarium oxysporum f. sp. albedinis]|nr:Uncharacterized protein HZ326_10767 [Fusarium oxysporum f. sp. albedinis]
MSSNSWETERTISFTKQKNKLEKAAPSINEGFIRDKEGRTKQPHTKLDNFHLPLAHAPSSLTLLGQAGSIFST